jgi:CRISPR system Cascade subunit CasC
MSTFIQLHLLTSYPPSNLNRDDLGRPKTAVMGGKTRLRVSSQSLKRAWRTSDCFEETLSGNLGTRTKMMGVKIFESLHEKGKSEANAKKWAKQIAEVFGKLKAENKDKPLEELQIEQLAHFTPEEEERISKLVSKLVKDKKGPTEEDLDLLRKEHTAVDIAMFGRMLASKPACNTDAAVQVAHAISVHEVAIEDDYFTAVDDLNKGVEDLGAGHIGETEFAAGVFYIYVCVNRDLLLENLQKNKDLTDKALSALATACATIGPNGKQNSFGTRARANYMLAEKGDQQPRSLSVAFLKPIKAEDILAKAIEELEKRRDHFDKVYGKCADHRKIMNAETGEGSLEEIIRLVKE